MAGNSNWESILKWSLSQSDGTQPPRQISEEERKWFQEAVQGTQVDIVRRMKEITTVMQIPEEQLESQGVAVDELEGLLEELQEHVESIDNANDLKAIGGLEPLLSYLKSPHAPLRSRAAEVVSTVVQNNPKSQAHVMEAGGFPLLLTNFTSDADVTVQTKALGAISSLIRHNKPGSDAFRLGGGLAALKSALLVDNPRFQRKALYVFQYLVQESPSDATSALELGFGPTLAGLVTSSDPDVRQAALQSLLLISRQPENEAILLAENPSTSGSYNGKSLREILSGQMKALRKLEGPDLENLLEERHLVDQLWEQCFAGGSRTMTSGGRSEAEIDLGGGRGGSIRRGAEGEGVSGEGRRTGGSGSANQEAPVLLLGPPGGR